MDCHQAANSMQLFAEQNSAPPELPAALAHIATCANCRSRLGHLVRALASSDEDQLRCEECEAELPAFLAARDLGRHSEPVWAAVTLHLATCPSCAVALAELAAMLPDTSLLPQPTPALRLDFLRTATKQPWRLDDLGQVLIDLVRALQPSGLTPGLKHGEEQAIVAEVSIDDAVPDLTIQIAVEGRRDSDTRMLLVTVDVPSRGGWPNLGGSEVTLLRDGVVTDRQLTDMFGTVVFTGLSTHEFERYNLAVRAVR